MTHLTVKEEIFLSYTDSELVNEVIEEIMLYPEDQLTFAELKARYQEKHLQKYGEYLTIQ